MTMIGNTSSNCSSFIPSFAAVAFAPKAFAEHKPAAKCDDVRLSRELHDDAEGGEGLLHGLMENFAAKDAGGCKTGGCGAQANGARTAQAQRAQQAQQGGSRLDTVLSQMAISALSGAMRGGQGMGIGGFAGGDCQQLAELYEKNGGQNNPALRPETHQLVQLALSAGGGAGSVGNGFGGSGKPNLGSLVNGNVPMSRGQATSFGAGSGATGSAGASRSGSAGASVGSAGRAGQSATTSVNNGDYRRSQNQKVIDNAANGWVKVLPEAHDNPLGLIMTSAERKPGELPRATAFDSSASLENVHVFHDVDTRKPYLSANVGHTLDNYWNKARTPDGLDYSALASTGPGTGKDSKYTSSEVGRIAVEMTAHEIYPADYVNFGIESSTKNKDEITLTRMYQRLNYEKVSPEDSQETLQNRHESAKFSFAAANYKEHGGKFDDKALDKFLSEQLSVKDIQSDTADGPRGLQLAKLSEVAKAISDGKVEIEDLVKSGVVPEDQAKKFEVSLKAIEHGEIRVDVSKITNKSSASEVKDTIVKATETRHKDKEQRYSQRLAEIGKK